MNNKLVYMNFQKYLKKVLNFKSNNFDKKLYKIYPSINLTNNLNVPVLPNGLYVDGYLKLSGTNLTVLPDDLYCTGYIDITCSIIKVLPSYLSCSNLYLGGSNVTYIPDYTYIGIGISGLAKYNGEYVGGYFINHEKGFSVLVKKNTQDQRWLMPSF